MTTTAAPLHGWIDMPVGISNWPDLECSRRDDALNAVFTFCNFLKPEDLDGASVERSGYWWRVTLRSGLVALVEEEPDADFDGERYHDTTSWHVREVLRR